MKPALAIDPDFGLAARLLSSIRQVNFGIPGCVPHWAAQQRSQAACTIKNLIEAQHRADRDWQRHAGRETDEFISEVLKTMERKPIKVVVNESVHPFIPQEAIAEFFRS